MRIKYEVSAGGLVLRRNGAALEALLIGRGNPRVWSLPKGHVEARETHEQAALREVREETTLDDISFDWGMVFIETGPYNKGKIARYYLARSKQEKIGLPINPALGIPEHQEARWFSYEQALSIVSPRLQPVVHWAYTIVYQNPPPLKA